MSTAARKARKRAGIKFEKAPKVPTLKYRTKREIQKITRHTDIFNMNLWRYIR